MTMKTIFRLRELEDPQLDSLIDELQLDFSQLNELERPDVIIKKNFSFQYFNKLPIVAKVSDSGSGLAENVVTNYDLT